MEMTLDDIFDPGFDPEFDSEFDSEFETEDSGFEDQIFSNTEDFYLTFDPESLGFTDEQSLLLTVQMADGSALPDWFEFDPVLGTLSGMPPAGFHGKLSLVAIASDGVNSAQQSFDLTFAQAFVGSAGDDDLEGTDDSDIFECGLGDDVIDGGLGDDKIWGDEGNDDLNGGLGDDQLLGGLGKDKLVGNGGNDTLYGEEGDDQLLGGLGADDLEAGVGKDQLLGDAGNDQLLGDDGNDQLIGGAGSDQLVGGNGSDQLMGNNGNDVLMGSAGRDRLTGGAGRDIFVLSPGAGSATIFDFHKATDKLGLINGIQFSNLHITYARGNTLISLSSNNDLLASLHGKVRLTAANFTTELPTSLSTEL